MTSVGAARFVTVEGIDGAGKSTHLPHIAQLMEQLTRRKVLVTREPGGSPLGEKLRELLLYQDMHAGVETLLMFAARQEHLEKVIKPALSSGMHVLSDRFTDSSFVYQGVGRGVDTDKITELEYWIDAIQPDLTLLFDLPVAEGMARYAQSRNMDRFEQEDMDFHERIRRGYLRRAEFSAGRIQVLDASKPVVEIVEHISNILHTLLT